MPLTLPEPRPRDTAHGPCVPRLQADLPLKLEPQGAVPKEKRTLQDARCCLQTLVWRGDAPVFGEGMELQAPAEGSWDFLGKKVEWVRVVPAPQLSGCMAVGQTATLVQLELRKWAATAAFFERKWRGKVKGLCQLCKWHVHDRPCLDNTISATIGTTPGSHTLLGQSLMVSKIEGFRV